MFCAGVGVQTPDITNSSRRIKQSEFETCRKNGVKEIIEVKTRDQDNTKASFSLSYARKLMSVFRASTPPKIEGQMDAISERELEVLYLIAAGLSNREIAEKLFISLNTVKTHTKNINSKLDVNSRTKAVVRAKELKLI